VTIGYIGIYSNRLLSQYYNYMLLRKNKSFPVSIYSIHEQLENMSDSPFYKTGVSKSPLFQNILPDPKITKPKQARKMKRSGEITKEEFKQYKADRKANKQERKLVITAGDTGNMNVKGDGGPNEDYRVAIKRKKWDRAVRMKKRGSDKAGAYDAKLRASSPRAYKYGSKETDYYDVKLDPKEDKKAAKQRYKKYKNT